MPIYRWVIETNYGQGWEEESRYDSKQEAEADFPEYAIFAEHYGAKIRIRKAMIK
jgi:hypothetical protein